MIMLKKQETFIRHLSRKSRRFSGSKIRSSLLVGQESVLIIFEAWGENENTELAHVNLPSIVGI